MSHRRMCAQRMCVAERLAFHLGTYSSHTRREQCGSHAAPAGHHLEIWGHTCTSLQQKTWKWSLDSHINIISVVSLYISAEYATHMTKSSVEGQCFSLSPPSSLPLFLYEWEVRKMTPSPSLLIMNKGKLHERQVGCSSTTAAPLPVWTHACEP